jgi:hypothetical protein
VVDVPAGGQVSAVAAWCLAAALVHAPPATRPQFPGHEETPEQTRERYVAICADIEAAATEHPERPGFIGHREKAALLLALAIGESGLSRDADLGPCYRVGKWRARCDGGRAASVWQLQATRDDDAEQTELGPKQLFADRRRAARVALRIAIGSIGMCRKLPPEDRLSAYGAGRCLTGDYRGASSVRARWRLFQRLRGWTPKEADS